MENLLFANTEKNLSALVNVTFDSNGTHAEDGGNELLAAATAFEVHKQLNKKAIIIDHRVRALLPLIYYRLRL